MRKAFLFMPVILILTGTDLFAQVITNEGAAIHLTPGIVVGSKDLFNNTVGNLLNNGTLNLSGNFTSVATTSGDGLYRIGGNWTNNCISFIPGLSTVIFNGASNQSVIRSGGETFYNLSISNTGTAPTNRVVISNDVTVTDTLSMSTGNVDAAAFKLYLSNQAAGSLNYTSNTGSRIFGRFERGVNETAGIYLFPLGSIRYYNPANLKVNSLLSAGSVVSHFDTLPAPGNAGLPIPDPPVEIAETYPDAFWSLTAGNSFASNDFNINLNATGFVDTIWSTTRVLKRASGGPWTVDGTHQIVDTVNNVVFRNNLTGNLSPTGSEFALGRAHPLITIHPRDTIVCEHAYPVFSVTATGAGRLTYRWYKDGVLITNGPGYDGNRSPNLTVNDVDLSDAGTYYCEVRDRYGNKTQSHSATLVVNKIPVAIVSIAMQPHECSGIEFDDIVLGLNYWDPGTTFLWERDTPSEIITSIAESGTAFNIGDVLEGAFTNTSDDPITITFLITPVGPGPTYCTGLQIQSSVRVNPTPRVVSVNIKPEICNNGTTDITLTTPTHMTQGTIMFDYWTEVDGNPGDLIGSMPVAVNQLPGGQFNLPYQNKADSMRSVFYIVLPKNVVSGCNSGPLDTAEVKVHPNPFQKMVISTPFTCTGASSGVLTVTLSKVSKPTKLEWTRPWAPLPLVYFTSSSTDTLEVNYAGNYRVKVTDNFGCENMGSQPVSGSQFNSQLFIKNKIDTGFGTSCPDAADGEIWIWEEAVTAKAPYEFWLLRNGTDTVSHDTLWDKGVTFRKELTSLPSGHYQLFVKDSIGCNNEIPPSDYIISPDPITVEFDKFEYPGGFNVSCKGFSDGTVSSTISGGNGGYIYKWTKEGGTISGPDNLSSLTGISAGKYYLLTTDAHNCTKLDSVTLIEPDGLSLASLVPSLYDGSYNISCAGSTDGSIELTIAGGSGNYNYSWSNGATTKDISNLSAGTYTVTVTDQADAGCYLNPKPSVTLIEPDALMISVAKSLAMDGLNNINCYNGTGSVDITVTGGSPATYTYTWTTTNGSGLVAGQEDQGSLKAGTYHLLVEDANGCQSETDITLTEPPALQSILVPTHITCASPLYNNGEIDMTISGGVTTYNYIWSNGALTEDITGLTQGYYKATITDFNGCTRIDSVRVNLPPPVNYISVLSDYNGYNVSCNGMMNGSIDITPTSGNAPYIFSWQKIGDPFTAATEDITGLSEGQYSLRITDDNLCIATDTIEITEPGKLDMNIVLSQSTAGEFEINCAGTNTGFINVVPVNQAGSVSYLWADGPTDQNRLNLFAGDYSLIIRDSNGCLADSAFTLREPDSLKLEMSVSPPWCSDRPDGSINLTVSGGVIGTDYTYRWSDESVTRDITDILSGMYTITVTDLNKCSIKDSVYVEPQQETCLVIPNAISPNGDNINDEWNIGLIELYQNVEVKVFNRWGEIVWRSEKGYPKPWDGRSNGKALPIDSYHYLIDYNNGRKPVIGNVTIVR